MVTNKTDVRIDITKDQGICQGMTIAVVIPVTSDGSTPVNLLAGGYQPEWTLYDAAGDANELIATKTIGNGGIALVDAVATKDGVQFTLQAADTIDAQGNEIVASGRWFYELWDAASGRRICYGNFDLLPSNRRS